MGYMEDNAKRLLKKVVATVVATMLWMFINMVFGIYNGWMFFDDSPATGNIIFYTWMLLSLAGLIVFFYKTWKEKFPVD